MNTPETQAPKQETTMGPATATQDETQPSTNKKSNFLKSVLIAVAAVLLVSLIALGVLCILQSGKGESEEKGTEAEDQEEEQSAKPPEERKFVALGDSFSKANNLSAEKPGDNIDYSFSTGTEINSVYLYLDNKPENNLTPVNLASSGATSTEVLENQVPNVPSFHPKYITLLVGGSDIVENVTVEQFKQNLSEIISQIKDEETTIIIATIPNIAKMQGATYPACGENKLSLDLENLTQENIQAFNQAIEEIALQNALILVDLYEADILGPDEVSDYDCLHPNMEGQKKIADEFIRVLTGLTQ